ncbi:hypothetical protein Acsp06_11230 [Actinomycetospora sp. NBRC 106375]|uniref:DUF2505 domain-containing protein n=1 Tax=Actinomycetospora sp. NBRC 106375 TaxID=3032207 RepID=UPI0024A3B078|nr:DUF2505 domain-containing protein [Actinomycetospora sp. NBRC 106375]GLZ44938.1 hypothetical protein Acsp06_11230 [Actinomycetospora sp. NBRC 106375]
MSTRLALSRDYPHGVPAFAAALADPEFHRVKLDVDGSGRIEVAAFARDDDPGGRQRIRVVLRQPVPPGQVPAVVERLLAGVLVIERTEEWRLGPDRCDGRAQVAVPGTPISAAGTMSVTAGAPDHSRLSVDLAITAAVPLLGGGIERAVVTGIRGLTGTEHDRISRWLAGAERAG